MAARSFEFRFDPRYRALARPFGVNPSNCRLELDESTLRVRFGPWRVNTERANITGAELTGPYQLIRTAGPAHLSFSDRGLTMATNGERGVCLSFAVPVRGIEPTGLLRHPGLTVTVADCDGLLAEFAG